MSRKRAPKKQINTEGWLTTWADLMNLLLCFFVLLYAFSTMDAVKFQQIVFSMAKAFGGNANVITSGGNLGPVPVNSNPGVEIETKDRQPGKVNLEVQKGETQKVYNQVKEFVQKNNLEAKITVREDIKGVVIELQEKILFDSGRSDIKPESLPLLTKISQLLSVFNNEIVVEGHTDNVPINRGYFQSNWELSADRAVKVVRFLVENKGVSPERITAVGAGEFRPIASNATPEGRQKNRRVNILIVTKSEGEK
ncbi:Motility protein B [Caloramator mitchellensis]|uniref:Motility protein B n=1 Tax=Caloramator mitchellensis TaxID=908809 RepID=A0A0R3JU32_CALMK|nr:OmpA family protein [Caloramator mitchellensis]KRQ87049.1 Motility protein B [Caloramator mitchellensis]